MRDLLLAGQDTVHSGRGGRPSQVVARASERVKPSSTISLLQRSAGNAAVAQLLAKGQPTAPAREEAEPAVTTGGKVLNIEFDAFIPGALGRPFKSFPHAKDLGNQPAFDADVAAVTSPDSWKPEPRKTEDDVKDPGSARKAWFYSTDERTFGGGSHRVGFKGTVNTAEIGALGGTRRIFAHDCNASHRVRSTDTGWFTSRGETGSIDGPYAKTAPVKDVEETVVDTGSSSTVETRGSAAYAFMPILSPDIDYKIKFKFEKKSGGGVEVSTWIEHNLFPYYEILVNGTRIWSFTSADTGPTLTNLNSSTKYFQGPWSF